MNMGSESATYGIECAITSICIVEPARWIFRVTFRNLEILAIAIPRLQAVSGLLWTAAEVCLQGTVMPSSHVSLHTISVSSIGKRIIHAYSDIIKAWPEPDLTARHQSRYLGIFPDTCSVLSAAVVGG